MFDYDILLVNPPMVYIKSKEAQFGSMHVTEGAEYRTFNPGILSIGTYLNWKGYSVKVIDLLGKGLSDLQRSLESAKPLVVGISCSYGLCYLPSMEIAKLVKRISPDSLVVAGGEHVGLLGTLALDDCEEIEVVVKYEGEIPAEELIEFKKGAKKIEGIDGIIFRKSLLGNSNGMRTPTSLASLPVVSANTVKDRSHYYDSGRYPKTVDLDEMPFLKYELYDDYMSYPPYVEESRGCAWSCEFCAAVVMSRRRMRIKTAERFVDELKYTAGIYGTEIQYPILAATFGVNPENTQRLCEGIRREFGQLDWATEFRVDIRWEQFIGSMYASGCRSFAVGIESASPEILHRMRKTKNPDFYISKAEKLIEHVSQFPNSIMHTNLMFYVGETPKTVKETTKFLMKWIDHIHSVHYSPVIVYPSSPLFRSFPRYAEETGATLVQGSPWDEMRIHPVNPSQYFSYEDAGHHARMMEKLSMDEEKYYHLHETRFSREEDGMVSDEKKQKFLDQMLLAEY